MNDQSDLALFIQFALGIWIFFSIFAIPIYLGQIAKNTKRIADRMDWKK